MLWRRLALPPENINSLPDARHNVLICFGRALGAWRLKKQLLGYSALIASVAKFNKMRLM